MSQFHRVLELFFIQNFHFFFFFILSFNLESSESTKIVEIFTNKGQSLGVDVIRYRNKLQLLADVLCDILKSDEFICQSLQLDEYSQEAMSVMVANWFKCEDKTSPSGDIQYLLTQWTTSLKCEQCKCYE